MNGIEQERKFHVIIIGGSYAGLAAAMALGRALRNVLVIDAGNPCNKQTPFSHNFLTNDGKTPGEIATVARHQVSLYDTVRFMKGSVTTVIKTDDSFQVEVDGHERFVSRKLIFATGIKDLLPSMAGFAECWGISVLHCPYCHGYEVRNLKTGILGNGDAGLEMCSLLSNWTSDLTLYTNGESTLTETQFSKLKDHKVNIVQEEIHELEHTNGHIENIIFKNAKRIKLEALYARLPFQQHSNIPQDLGCELTEEAYIRTDAMQRTTVAGIYACGDNTTRIRTLANAVAMGTTAGMMVNKELIEENF